MMGPTKRDPPAFQCYASDILADEAFSEACASERGVLFSMLMYCWVNRSVPAAPTRMARLLKLTDGEVAAALAGQLIARHFVASGDNEVRFHCPELDRQRTERKAYFEGQAQRGRLGGRRTQQRAAAAKEGAPESGDVKDRLKRLNSGAGTAASSTASSDGKAPEKRGEEQKRNSVFRTADAEDEWVREYTETQQAADQYRAESRGK